jgi:hypothetical protein
MDDVNACCDRSRWPKTSKACGAFWRECEYIRLCRSEHDKESFDSTLQAMYREDKWSPYPEARIGSKEREG